MGTYLGEYVSHFGLEPCIKLNTRVHQVRPTADARWSVRWRGQEEEEEGEGTFDRLVLASGFFGPASLPIGLDTAAFRDNPRNILMHSMDYRDPTPFKGRSVLVLGSAFSGVEVASEVSSVAKQVAMVARRGAYVLPRYVKDVPIDLALYDRTRLGKTAHLSPEQREEAAHAYLQSICSGVVPYVSGQAPSGPPQVAVSDAYVAGVLQHLSSPVAAFGPNGVTLADGTQQACDAVILCTGYKLALDYLDSATLRTLEFDSNDQHTPLALYKQTLHPSLPTLACVGVYRGPYLACMELQAHTYTYILTDLHTYEHTYMLTDIQT
jgi:dimethylaniline monooxygenase (N-oxide forming)